MNEHAFRNNWFKTVMGPRFENLYENSEILESQINEEDNSTNLIYRFADINVFFARYLYSGVRKYRTIPFVVN